MHDRIERVVRAPNTSNPMQERRDLISDFRASSAAFALLNTQESIGSGGDHGDRIRTTFSSKACARSSRPAGAPSV
jgi:hypothetical protein